MVKLKAKYQAVPPEPARDASSKEQETYKIDKERIEGDNKKLDQEVAKREKAIERLTAKLKDDLRTLEKPNPPPPFLMALSARGHRVSAATDRKRARARAAGAGDGRKDASPLTHTST